MQELSTTLLASALAGPLPLPSTPTGHGLVAAYEFMVITPAIANTIRDNKTFRIDSMIQTGKKFGMQLLLTSTFCSTTTTFGKISAEEAHRQIPRRPRGNRRPHMGKKLNRPDLEKDNSPPEPQRR